MKIALANPPWNVEQGFYGVRAGSRWPAVRKLEGDGSKGYLPFPFFLAYAAAMLKASQHEVILIDAIASNYDDEEFVNKVLRFSPQLLVLEISTPSLKNDFQVIRLIKNNKPEILVGVCGPHATVFAQKLLTGEELIDYVFLGEFEGTVSNLVGCLKEGREGKELPGLGLRDQDSGRIIINQPQGSRINLDQLPWPQREALPIYKYNDGFCGLPKPNVQMLASRGCRYRCSFCLWPQVMFGSSLPRFRDPEKVVAEMEFLIKHYGFKAVYFDDDTFNNDLEYVGAFCQEIKKNKLKVPWAIMARPDLMTEDVLTKLASSGLYAVKYGIESAESAILNNCGKNLDLPLAKKNILFTKSLGIKTHLTFCLGLPGETRSSLEKMKMFLSELDPDSAQFSLVVPFPGTRLYTEVRKKNYLPAKSYSDYCGVQRAIAGTDELSPFELEQEFNNITAWWDKYLVKKNDS
jgi:radical SAM superfamily enzyme YgiQ (UPF0313 family)